VFDLDRFLADDPGGPVVMLNLLKFRPGGRAWYEEYGPALQDTAAQVLYVGEGGHSLQGEEWDMVVLVRYPSRRAFATMVGSPEYAAIAHLRTEALTDAVLQPTRPV
jgi:uncharacterized protein (DUF1330 family)